MTELGKNIVSCCVTTFHSPSTFWLIFDKDICARSELFEKLNHHREAKYALLTEGVEGEVVIFEHKDHWVRGQIAQVLKGTSHVEYLCWLVDYGVFSYTKEIYNLPDKYRIIPPFARKAMLYGLLSLKRGDRFDGVTQTEDIILKKWAAGITKYSNQLIKSSNTNHKFRTKFTSDDFVVGDLFLQNEKGCTNIRENLLSTNLATFNEDLFLKHLEDLKKSQETLANIFIQTKFFSESDNLLLQTQIGYLGRGTYRSLTKAYQESKKRHTKPKEIPAGILTDTKVELLIPSTQKNMAFTSPPSVGLGRGEKLKMLLENKQNISSKQVASSQQGILKLDTMHANKSDKNKSDSNIFVSDSNFEDQVLCSGRGLAKVKSEWKTANFDDEVESAGRGFGKLSVSEGSKGKTASKSKNDSKTSNRILNKQNTLSELEIPKFIRSVKSDKSEISCNKNESVSNNLDTDSNCDQVCSGRSLRKVESKWDTQSSDDEVESAGRGSGKRSTSASSFCRKKTELETRKFVEFVKSETQSSSSRMNSVRKLLKGSAKTVDNDVLGDAWETISNSSSTSSKKSPIRDSSPAIGANSVQKSSKAISDNLLEDLDGTGSSSSSTSSKKSPFHDSSASESDSLRKSSKEFRKTANNDLFEDADETTSNSSEISSRKSVFRDGSSKEFVKCIPAGASFTPKKVKSKMAAASQERPTTELKTAEIVKQFEKSVQHEKDPIPEKPKNIAGLCDCPVCDGWRNNDNVFVPSCSEPPKKEEKPKFVLKPPLLFKTDDEKEINYKVTTKREFSSYTEKLAAPRVLVHSALQIGGSLEIHQTPFDDSVQSALRKLNYSSAHSIQTYTWPAVLRGLNVIAVSMADCGKTMVYVPAICNSTFHEDPDLPNVVGPTAVVLCPRVEIVENVYRLFCAILQKTNKNIKCHFVSHFYEKSSTQKLTRGVDILITTPRLFIELLREEVISLKRLCHLILEEAHELFPSFSPELTNIFRKTQKVLEKRTEYFQTQLIVISQEWTKQIEEFAKNLKLLPLISIGAHLEAALYGKADIKITLSTIKDKPIKTVETIKENFQYRKTVIICTDDEDPEDLSKHLEAHGIYYETLLVKSTVETIDSVKERWFNAVPGKYFVLLCCDNIFNTGLAITDAEIIVQYSLPENWSQFTFRFSGFVDSYSCPLVTKPEDMNKCKILILLDETNTKQFPKMIQFLKRMGTKLPKNLLKYHKEFIEDMEKTKLINNVNICEKMLLFGSCKNKIVCNYRHIFCPKVDIPSYLPKSGLIKCKILNVENPVHYYVRLIEHTDSEGVCQKFCDNYGFIATQLLAVEKRAEMKHIIEGKIFAVKQLDGVTSGSFYRARIIERGKKTVLVRYIDIGCEQDVKYEQIYRLPTAIKKIPPQCTSAYVSNVGPRDGDSSWPRRCLSLLKRILNNNEFSNANCYFTGRIKLQVGDALFVDDLKLYETLDKDFELQKLSIREALSKLNAIEERPNHLKDLYNRCKNYSIPLYDYSLPVIKVSVKVEPQATPTWAHLENSQEFNTVFFSLAHSPDSFFVKLSKFTDCLENLNKSIKSTMEKPFYRKVTAPKEGHCYLVFDHVDQTYNRAIVTKIKDNIADCFFVDYGDSTEVTLDELKYLPDELITQLPFQVIECKLHGIKPSSKDGKWLSEASDIFYDLVYEPGTNFYRFLHVKVIGEEAPQYTSYKKYSVILLNTFERDIIVNNTFLDMGFAVSTTKERIDIDFTKLHYKCNTENDEESDSENQEIVLNLQTIEENEEMHFEEDNKWDFQVNDREEFFRQLFGRPKQNENCLENGTSSIEYPKQIANSTSRFEDQSTSQKAGSSSKTSRILPKGYSTPSVIWQQNETHVIIKIQIPSVTDYNLKIIRETILTFKTSCQGTEYRLDLSLFAKVNKNCDHRNLGICVEVKLEKLKAEEWPRLILSKGKARHISYNFTALDDDSDEDRPLPQEMIENSKILGQQMNKDDGQYVYEYGSDIDWEESDLESLSDSGED